jgi:transposase
MLDGKVQIVSGRERRRRWSIDEKLRLVAETYEPGACAPGCGEPGRLSGAAVLLFTWRRQVREGTLARSPPAVFLPVRAAREPQDPVPAPSERVMSRAAGQIEIELKDGRKTRRSARPWGKHVIVEALSEYAPPVSVAAAAGGLGG